MSKLRPNRRTGKEINCLNCGDKFYAAQWELNNGRKYCKSDCQKTGEDLTCRGCNKVFYAPAWDIARGRKYCSHKCSEIGSGAYITSDGYVKVMQKSHPRADKGGFVYEHVLVMERHLGRKVKRGEIVHHINHNRSDNTISNLQLLDSQSTHFSLHQVWKFRKNILQKGLDK